MKEEDAEDGNASESIEGWDTSQARAGLGATSNTRRRKRHRFVPVTPFVNRGTGPMQEPSVAATTKERTIRRASHNRVALFRVRELPRIEITGGEALCFQNWK